MLNAYPEPRINTNAKSWQLWATRQWGRIHPLTHLLVRLRAAFPSHTITAPEFVARQESSAFSGSVFSLYMYIERIPFFTVFHMTINLFSLNNRILWWIIWLMLFWTIGSTNSVVTIQYFRVQMFSNSWLHCVILFFAVVSLQLVHFASSVVITQWQQSVFFILDNYDGDRSRNKHCPLMSSSLYTTG